MPSFRPATLRHLLTHTAGIPDVRQFTDLLHASFTPSGGRPPQLSVEFGQRLPSLAEYYRGGLRIVVEPGSAFAYSNHGYATLGQVVEDVAGIPLERFFRERIFEPLGMADSDLVRSDRIASRLATGYAMGGQVRRPSRIATGSAPAPAGSTRRRATSPGSSPPCSAVAPTSTGACSSPRRSRAMFQPHYQPDGRLPGMGLGFFLAEAGGHRLVLHDGILPGFNSELLVAPDDGIGVIGLTNGSSGAFAWLSIELGRLLRDVLGLPEEAPRSDVPHHPEVWTELCGRYVFPPRISDLRQRLMLGFGADVLVRGGRLTVRLLTPVPALYRGLPLQPDDPADPYVFRLDLSPYGLSPVRVVFGPVVDGHATRAHTDLGGQPWSLIRVPDAGPRRASAGLVVGALGALAVASAAGFVARRRGQSMGG